MGDEPMTLVLDTHVWLWAVEAPEKLGRRTKALLLNSGNERFVSAISALEIARLCLDERLIFSVSPKTWIEDSARDLHLQHVDVGYAIALEAYTLPNPFHRDPADRTGGHGAVVSSNLINRRRADFGLQPCADARLQDLTVRRVGDRGKRVGEMA